MLSTNLRSSWERGRVNMIFSKGLDIDGEGIGANNAKHQFA